MSSRQSNEPTDDGANQQIDCCFYIEKYPQSLFQGDWRVYFPTAVSVATRSLIQKNGKKVCFENKLAFALSLGVSGRQNIV